MLFLAVDLAMEPFDPVKPSGGESLCLTAMLPWTARPLILLRHVQAVCAAAILDLESHWQVARKVRHCRKKPTE